jgi:hypothetical protein
MRAISGLRGARELEGNMRALLPRCCFALPCALVIGAAASMTSDVKINSAALERTAESILDIDSLDSFSDRDDEDLFCRGTS